MARATASKEEEEETMLTLKSSDNEDFLVAKSVAIQSAAITNLVGHECLLSTIPLPNVTSKTLAKVIEYLNRHADPKASEEDLNTFDKEFIRKTISESPDEFTNLMLAAHYLDIDGLLDITCQKVADSIKDLSVEEVRKRFGIKNDYTPEEEEKVRNEYAWAFQ